MHAQDYDVWNVIVKDSYTHTILIDGESISKSKKNWDEQDKRLA